MADSMIAVSTTVVDTVMALNLDGHLDRLHHLEGDFLGDVHGYLDSLDVLESFSDRDMLNNGDLDGNLDGVGFGDQLDLGGDGGVGNLSVSLGVDHLGISVDRVAIGVSPMMARDTMAAMAVVAEAVCAVEIRHGQARDPESNGAPHEGEG